VSAPTSPADLVILGGGSGGYAAAFRATELGLNVVLIEKDKVGGTCLHRGCIPTKALLHAGEVADLAREGESFGVKTSLAGIDMDGVNAYKDGVVSKLYKGLQGLVKARKITYVEGEGRLTSPTTVEVNGQTYEGKHILLATGSYARSLPGLEIDGTKVITSDHALALDRVPASAIVLGGGVIGCEFASVWRSFGAEVTILEALPRLVALEDEASSKALERAFKKLPLLVAYVSLFVVAASTVRRGEVRAFMNFILALSVICALGMLFEFRFHQNPFYNLSDKLLPGIFTVVRFDATLIDDIGRSKLCGPTAVPLEAVAMLSMALPIAIVGLIHSQRWRPRLWYALAAGLLLAAIIATDRKSALLAPLSVILTIAYFRRGQLLKLAPLGLVLVMFVHVLAPGSLGHTTDQFDPSRLGVATVSDRTADYDAVRPDIWTHLIFGRGWGTYDHVTYRILDSELLHRVIEMGVLGLLVFIAMPVAVVLSARATIAARDPRWSPLALIGAAAAVSFLVVSMLFDVLSFPHPTYVFMLMAGLMTVVLAKQPPVAERPSEHHGRRARPTSASRRARALGAPSLGPLAPRR